MPSGIYKGNKGKKVSYETKQKLSKAFTGKNNPFYGMKHTEKTKKKISESLIGRKKPMRTKEHCKNLSKALTGIKKDKLCGENNPAKRANVRKKISEAKKGSKWNLSKRKRNQFQNNLYLLLRSCSEYVDWRHKIYNRDNHTCKMCGKINCCVHAHHIFSFIKIIDSNELKTFDDAIQCKQLWDINNGITLCKDCHKQIHLNMR